MELLKVSTFLAACLATCFATYGKENGYGHGHGYGDSNAYKKIHIDQPKILLDNAKIILDRPRIHHIDEEPVYVRKTYQAAVHATPSAVAPIIINGGYGGYGNAHAHGGKVLAGPLVVAPAPIQHHNVLVRRPVVLANDHAHDHYDNHYNGYHAAPLVHAAPLISSQYLAKGLHEKTVVYERAPVILSGHDLGGHGGYGVAGHGLGGQGGYGLASHGLAGYGAGYGLAGHAVAAHGAGYGVAAHGAGYGHLQKDAHSGSYKKY